jgi:hypothetical protein
MARKQKAPEVTIVAASKRELLSSMTKFTRARIEREIETAREEIAKWGQQIAESKENPTGDLIYKMQWAERVTFRAAFAFHQESVMAIYARRLAEGDDESRALFFALNAEVKRVSEYLLRDGYAGNSSSHFSNATEHTRRAAASQFYRDLHSFVGALEKAIEDAA